MKMTRLSLLLGTIGLCLVAALLFLVAEDARAEGLEIDPTLTPTKALVCDMPVAREDGTPLAVGDIAKVDFYSSGDKTTWIPAGTNTTCRLSIDFTAMPDGQYYYLARAVDTGGRESKDSNIRPFTLKRIKPPMAPALRWEWVPYWRGCRCAGDG